jgi:hypothetical protein
MLRSGSVAERLKAAVLKTAVPQGTRGSNPLASAIEGLIEYETQGFLASL